MTYVKHVSVKKKLMIFKHEVFKLDLNNASKARLYSGNTLLFMGDGYKAIQILLQNCKDKTPVKTKFHSQLSMREKPKFKDT
jgi:hypothetical protein|tara:strand:- start:341 stop:586 length:246 start_codon:yes stop_codon:yes gene_type:complete